MNAFIYILLSLSFFQMKAGIYQNHSVDIGYTPAQSLVELEVKSLKVDRMIINPRTVVVLEDTHFKPAK